MNMDIQTLRSKWSDVLDELERQDRMAWIAFFDARLASLHGKTLTLDFSDSRKFANNLEYHHIRDQHRIALQKAIEEIVGVDLDVVDGS